jgi:hypothetical protein
LAQSLTDLEPRMTVVDYAEKFFGLPIVDFRHGEAIKRRDCVYRLMQETYDAEESQRELLDGFLAQVDAESLEALVIGPWNEASSDGPDGFLEGLIEAQLPALKALFVGDMTYEDCEMSWIIQTDYAPLLAAYPKLEVLRIRGTNELTLPKLSLPNLRELAIESGGLPSAIVRTIGDSELPALQKLELWLGDEGYGFDGDLATYKDLLAKIQPKRLDYLGLRNSEISDQLAGYLAQQSWLGSLHTLDLSMGTLGDDGAKALLASQFLQGLKVLDVRHHYISKSVVEQLAALPLTLEIDEAEEADDGDRYVQVSE